MKMIKHIAAYVLLPLLFVPCLAIFSDSKDYHVNLFGWLYAIMLIALIKLLPAFKSVFRKWRKSAHKIFPEINNL